MRLCGNLARYIFSYYIHWMNLPSYKPLPSPLLFCRTHSWKLSSLQGFRLFWPVFRWEFVCHSESLIFLLPRWVFVSGVRLFLCKGPLCLPKNKTMKKLHTLTELINNMADETTNGIIVMFPYVPILTFYQFVIVCLQSCTLLRHRHQNEAKKHVLFLDKLNGRSVLWFLSLLVFDSRCPGYSCLVFRRTRKNSVVGVEGRGLFRYSGPTSRKFFQHYCVFSPAFFGELKMKWWQKYFPLPTSYWPQSSNT